ncbi:MAG: hypothetical protein JXM70_12270 [Pirellulales bacterium]|nr:hypothetical protein [Pirellulales bacterium]
MKPNGGVPDIRSAVDGADFVAECLTAIRCNSRFRRWRHYPSAMQRVDAVDDGLR